MLPKFQLEERKKKHDYKGKFSHIQSPRTFCRNITNNSILRVFLLEIMWERTFSHYFQSKCHKNAHLIAGILIAFNSKDLKKTFSHDISSGRGWSWRALSSSTPTSMGMSRGELSSESGRARIAEDTERQEIWWSSPCNESTCKRGKAAPSKRKWQKEGHWYLYYIAQSNSRMNFSIICIFKIILPIKECKWYGKYEGEGKILGFVVFKKVLCADHPWGVFMWNQNFYVESRCLHCHTASLKEMKS